MGSLFTTPPQRGRQIGMERDASNFLRRRNKWVRFAMWKYSGHGRRGSDWTLEQRDYAVAALGGIAILMFTLMFALRAMAGFWT